MWNPRRATRCRAFAVKINRENASQFGLNASTIGALVRGELTGSTATTLRMMARNTM